MWLLAGLVRLVGVVFSLFPHRQRIALMSRQSRRPLDFVVLEPWLRRAFPDYEIAWCCVRHNGKLGLITMVRQLWLQATSSLCIVDGYVPAVCIPRADVDDEISHVYFVPDTGSDSTSDSGSTGIRSLLSVLAEAIGKAADSEDSNDCEDLDASEEFEGFRISGAAAGSRSAPLRTALASWRSLWRGARLAPCVQLWHAMGAIKCFGYQALNTSEGRSSHVAESLDMHRGYDVVVAGFRGAVPAFAQAFDCPMSHVRVLGSPRLDYLIGDDWKSRRAAAARNVARTLHLDLTAKGPVVLYAPTYRKHPANPDWHRNYVDALREALPDTATLIVSGHPLGGFAEADDANDSGAISDRRAVARSAEPWCKTERSSHGATVKYLHEAASIHALPLADYVVSDYSAVTLEAMAAGCKVLFYAPDIDSYRMSPGLNVDPERVLPTLTFRDARSLGAYISGDMADGSYDFDALAAFKHSYGIEEMCAEDGSACQRIIDMIALLISTPTSSDMDAAISR